MVLMGFGRQKSPHHTAYHDFIPSPVEMFDCVDCVTFSGVTSDGFCSFNPRLVNLLPNPVPSHQHPMEDIVSADQLPDVSKGQASKNGTALGENIVKLKPSCLWLTKL